MEKLFSETLASLTCMCVRLRLQYEGFLSFTSHWIFSSDNDLQTIYSADHAFKNPNLPEKFL
jgi:hypothetical protein